MSPDQYQFLIHPEDPFNGTTQSVYCPKTDRVQHTDWIRKDEKGNLSLEDYIEHTGIKWKIITCQELDQLDQAYQQSLVSDPSPIDEERFHEMLGMLPPCKYGTVLGVELFHMSERLTGRIASWYARVDNRYYTCNDFVTNETGQMAVKFDGFHNAALRA